jgi:hypothetical protein
MRHKDNPANLRELSRIFIPAFLSAPFHDSAILAIFSSAFGWVMFSKQLLLRRLQFRADWKRGSPSQSARKLP